MGQLKPWHCVKHGMDWKDWNGIKQRQNYHVSYTDIKMYHFGHRMTIIL